MNYQQKLSCFFSPFCMPSARLPHVEYDKLPQSNENFSKYNNWWFYIWSPMSDSLIEEHLKR